MTVIASAAMVCAALPFAVARKEFSRSESTVKAVKTTGALPNSEPVTTNVSAPRPQTSVQFDLSRSDIAGGGGTSTNGSLRVDGTVGQTSAGTTSTNSQFSIAGGFWQSASVATPTRTPTPTPTPTPAPTPSPTPSPTPTLLPTVQFDSSTYTVAKGETFVNLNVTRTGDTTGTSSVDYLTADGTADHKSSYTTALGTLKFAPGESQKSFPLLITMNGFARGTLSLAVALSKPAGAQSGTPSSATVQITDTSTQDSATNPVDDPQTFVSQHYHDFLDRQSDTAGLQFWTDQMTNCGASNPAVCRINVSAAFFLSIEFQQTGYLVYKMYKASFGNLPNKPVPVARASFLSDTREIASTPAQVVVNQTGWQQQLQTNEQAFALDFVQRQQFVTLYPTTMTPAQFVDALYANTGITPSVGDTSAAISEFGTASDTSDSTARSRALLDVAQNGAFTQAEFDRAFVLMQYFGYLQRNPDDQPDGNFAGYNFWLQKLNQFNGNFVQAEMVKAFLLSTEYRQRFGP